MHSQLKYDTLSVGIQASYITKASPRSFRRACGLTTLHDCKGPHGCLEIFPQAVIVDGSLLDIRVTESFSCHHPPSMELRFATRPAEALN